MKSGMVGQRINLDPTESFNNAMSPAQAQGPRLFDPGVLQPGANAPQPAGTTGMLSGPAQPMRQPQGPTLFDPTVGINLNQANAARQAGMMGSIGSIGMGNAQPMRKPQGPRRVRPNRPSRAMGRGVGAFGMRGRGPIASQQPKARGRGRGRGRLR
jgi:hypothetical protein